jgi:hypothetical protein
VQRVFPVVPTRDGVQRVFPVVPLNFR